MKSRNRSMKALALGAMVVIIAVTVSNRTARAISSFSFTSGLVGITQGQTARLSVVNTLDKDVQVELSFLDDGGKVLILRDGIVSAGKSFSENFQHPGGANRLEFRGVVREAAARRDSEAIIICLQVFDNETGKTTLMIGGDGWTGPITL
jgi:hypothetical protein